MVEQAVQSVHEPATRMAISGIDIVIDYHLRHLPRQGTEADDTLDDALDALRSAKDYLKDWAVVSDIQLREGMKT